MEIELRLTKEESKKLEEFGEVVLYQTYGNQKFRIILDRSEDD